MPLQLISPGNAFGYAAEEAVDRVEVVSLNCRLLIADTRKPGTGWPEPSVTVISTSKTFRSESIGTTQENEMAMTTIADTNMIVRRCITDLSDQELRER